MTTCDFLMSNRRYSARSRQWHFNLNLWWKLRKRGVPLGKRTRCFETLFGCYLCVCCLGDHSSSGARSCSHRMCRSKALRLLFRAKFANVCHTWIYRSLTPHQTQPEYFLFFSLAGPTNHQTLTMSSLSKWVTWIKKPQREEERRKKDFK